MGLLILLTLLIEVGVLLYLEVKAWHTLYTPLVFLTLPYVAVLLVTIAIAGRLGFVDFYYPTILFWIAGLLVFAIPSYVLGFAMQKHGKPVCKPIDDGNGLSKAVVVLTAIMCLAFLLRLLRPAEAMAVDSHPAAGVLCICPSGEGLGDNSVCGRPLHETLFG